MTRVFVSWSGGKDSCLACYRAIDGGMDVRYLFNTVSEDGQRSCSHGIAAEVIKKQAEAIGIPILQRRTTNDNYEAEFINMLQAFKEEGVTDGVFGDIDFDPHREWIEKVCRAADITPHLPLWKNSQTELLKEFIELGFKTMVIAARAEFFKENVLGKVIDPDFIGFLTELRRIKGITPCGEAGEYHTLVIDGPIFEKRLQILETRKINRNGIHFLEISNAAIKSKP
jgi:diphthine-ammonia ligase